MPTTTRLRLAALLIVPALLLAGCSDGDSDDVATDEPGTTTTAPEDGTATTDTTATSAPAATGEAVPSAGCGASEVGAVEKDEHTLDVDGAERMYLLTTPEAHDGHTPLPLVLDFHGLLEGAQLHSEISGYSELAQSEGFVVAFPNGSGGTGPGDPLRWDAGAETTDNVDVDFTEQLLDALGTDLCIDTSRVYSTGLSNGALFSSLLGCRLADRIAAIAPVAGALDPEPCDPTRPVSVIAFHGTADPLLPFNTTALPEPDLNGDGYPSNVAAWAERAGCDPEATDENVTERIIHRTYSCPDGSAVEFYILVGGGHDWPGNERTGLENGPDPDNPVMEIDATQLSWEFFQGIQLP